MQKKHVMEVILQSLPICRFAGRFLATASLKCMWLVANVVLTTNLLLAQLSLGNDDDLKLLERFVLAEDRQSILNETNDQTDQFHWLQALHWESSQRFDEIDHLLFEWEMLHGKTERWLQIERRLKLLLFDIRPDETYDHLIESLNLQFIHPDPKSFQTETEKERFERNRANDFYLENELLWQFRSVSGPPQINDLGVRMLRKHQSKITTEIQERIKQVSERLTDPRYLKIESPPVVRVGNDEPAREGVDKKMTQPSFRFHVERESLLPGNQATVLIRASFKAGGKMVTDLSSLSELMLRITSTDYDDVAHFEYVENVVLADDQETAIEFTVHPCLKEIRFDLMGHIASDSPSMNVSLGQASFSLAPSLAAGHQMSQSYLVRSGLQYWLERRDMTGALQSDTPTSFTLVPVWGNAERRQWCDTEADGRVGLGTLPGAAVVRLGGDWSLADQFRVEFPPQMVVASGQPLRLPQPLNRTPTSTEHWTVFRIEPSSQAVVNDVLLSIEPGWLQVNNLPPGHYVIRSDYGEQIEVRMLEADPLVVEENSKPTDGPPSISEVRVDGQDLMIKVDAASAQTRVHVTASYFVPAYGAANTLAGFPQSFPPMNHGQVANKTDAKSNGWVPPLYGPQFTDGRPMPFLADPARVLPNRRPNAEGVIRIPLAELGNKHHVTCTLVDREWTLVNTISLPSKDISIRESKDDIQLSPFAHYALRMEASQLKDGDRFVAPNVETMRYRAIK